MSSPRLLLESDPYRLSVESRSPLRVLLVSASSGSDGGGELYLVGLSEGLKALGHEVAVLLSSHPRMDKLAGLLAPWATVHREQYKNTYDRPLRAIGAVFDKPQIRRMARRFRAFSPDVIHINKQNLEDGLDLVAAASHSGLPFVTTIHITRSPRALRAWGGRIRDRIAHRALLRSSGFCLAIARGCADELQAWLNSAGRHTHVHCVLNGVGEAPHADREAIRREWNCRPDDLVMGCLARIEDQKNPLFLVGLLPDLPEWVRLVWVGDGRLRAEMLAAADRLGVRQRVHVDGWRSDGRARMAAFDIFALPSRFEGFPFAILEAMAAGLPCIVSDVDGNREAIVEGESGSLCPAGDRYAWLTRLRGLIENEHERDKLGQAARARYLDCFSLDAMARGTDKVYRAVIADAL
jgi:glycosyltransferase involved in cell wall biosynthesis